LVARPASKLYRDMKALLLLSSLTAFFVSAKAQGGSSIVTNPNVTVYQDTGIANLVQAYKDYNQKKEFTDGYRIQILYSNVRDEAYKIKSTMYVQFPDLAPYVEYESPNFKVRVGDFKTRLEATYYLQQVIPLYPGAFIVKDKIKTK
jgi:hypothetical protein